MIRFYIELHWDNCASFERYKYFTAAINTHLINNVNFERMPALLFYLSMNTFFNDLDAQGAEGQNTNFQSNRAIDPSEGDSVENDNADSEIETEEESDISEDDDLDSNSGDADEDESYSADKDLDDDIDESAIPE
ncbi:hypothetical protein GS399_06315 [Pedobacter sp. HMF7647]|uniref:Uncharacterized protein n=1 Tax=Hufsiella arboris TaxID=2695275 RepID=A0A7K1Y828_9SPHI|nr:hypothetical protein [Hufsiella arboris]MXV50580.1 hypothetical protein [Hufsiella arboris]